MKAKKVLITQHGQFDEALEVQAYSPPQPSANQVSIHLKYSPVHPSDIGTIQGSYGYLPEMPFIGGHEGMGVITSVGSNLDSSLVGKRAYTLSMNWQDVSVRHINDVHIVPDSVSDELGSMALINPATAWRLLHDFVDLQAGDYIVQNAANSAVGVSVIRLAKYLGLKTINIVRNSKWIEPLLGQGADYVFTEDSEWYKENKLSAKLALNSVGGMSAINILRILESDSPMVTFGGMTRDPVRLPTRQMIFNNNPLLGFWFGRWWASTSRDDHKALVDQIFSLHEQNVFDISVDSVYPLEQASEALDRAASYSRDGKVLLRSSISTP